MLKSKSHRFRAFLQRKQMPGGGGAKSRRDSTEDCKKSKSVERKIVSAKFGTKFFLKNIPFFLGGKTEVSPGEV